jgi:predicted dinucleotide-binding enzyme
VSEVGTIGGTVVEYIVTAKIEVSIIADTPEEADLEALDYLQGTMSIQEVKIEDVREADESS